MPPGAKTRASSERAEGATGSLCLGGARVSEETVGIEVADGGTPVGGVGVQNIVWQFHNSALLEEILILEGDVFGHVAGGNAAGAVAEGLVNGGGQERRFALQVDVLDRPGTAAPVGALRRRRNLPDLIAQRSQASRRYCRRSTRPRRWLERCWSRCR